MTALLTYFVHTFFNIHQVRSGRKLSIWQQLQRHKTPVIEPRDAALFTEAVQRFDDAVAVRGKGAGAALSSSLVYSSIMPHAPTTPLSLLLSCPLSLSRSLSLSLFLPRSRWRSSLRSVPRSHERGAQLLRQSSSCCRHHWPALSAGERSPHQIEKSVSRREIKRRTSCRRPLGWQQQQQQLAAAARSAVADYRSRRQ